MGWAIPHDYCTPAVQRALYNSWNPGKNQRILIRQFRIRKKTN